MSTTFETSLSDHHNLIYVILKRLFQKEEPKVLISNAFKKLRIQIFNVSIM